MICSRSCTSYRYKIREVSAPEDLDQDLDDETGDLIYLMCESFALKRVPGTILSQKKEGIFGNHSNT